MTQPAEAMAAPQDFTPPENLDQGPSQEAGPNRLSLEDRTLLAQGQEIDVIVEFDQTEAVHLAAARRRQAASRYDDETILAERVQSYRRQKNQMLTTLAAVSSTGTFKLKKDYSHLPMLSAQLRSSADLQALLQQPNIKAVHTNRQLQLLLTQSLPLIRQPETAAQGGAGAGATIAVLDTGVDYTRAAFGNCPTPGGACKVIYAADFAPDDGSRDDHGHGTNVAGIVLGVAPSARIAALDVFNGNLASSTDIIDAINWVIANKAAYNIVAMNLSLGGSSYSSLCALDSFATPIANARAAGILAAIASGNDGYKDKISSPACVPAAISVGAVYDSNAGARYWSTCSDTTTQADQVTCFSNSANFLTLLAPGSVISAAGLSMSGTSQATPHVAGALAVLRAAYPSESLDATVARLTNTGISITDNNGITKPRIDLLGAYTANRTAYSLTVEKAGTGSGVVNSNPTGIACGNQCNADFAAGTTLQLTATPNAGSTFTGWSGACTGTSICSVTMHAARSVTAIFTGSGLSLGEALDNTTLIWQTAGNAGWQGISLSDRDAARSGIIGNDQFSELHTSVTGPGTLAFQWKVSSEQDYDYLELWIDNVLQFSISGEVGWESRAVVIGAGAHEVQWIYRKDDSIANGEDVGWVDTVTFNPTQSNQPDLAVTQVTSPSNGTPGGKIEVSAALINQGSVTAGGLRLTFMLSTDSVITLGDINTGWECSFDGLSGGATGTCSGEIGIPTNISPGIYYLGAYADSNHTVVESNETNNGRAADNRITLSNSTLPLVVTLTGSGSGKVSSNPAGIDCGVQCNANFATGAMVTLTATSDTGAIFAGWSGDCTGTSSCTVNMTATQAVTALFNASNGGEIFPPNGAWSISSGDYNGDGRADLIWRQATTGQTYGMLLKGLQIIQQGMFYHEPDTAWKIVQNGDLDGNGQDDLLWWNHRTGQVWRMPLSGLNIAGGGMLYQEANTAWQIAVVGDLNGDGRDDLVWWNQVTGQVYGMLMKGAAIDAQGLIYQEANTAWRILAAQDFTGDGKADLLWRNVSTGQVYLMPMSGLSISGGAMVYQEPNLAWSIAATGDLDGDRRTDLVWWNSQTGQVYGMLMKGLIISAQGMIYQESNTLWRIVASGDYTGDGKADLLWRNTTTGQIYEMPMNGLLVAGGAVIYQEANTDWRIVANDDAPPLPAPGRSLAGTDHTATPSLSGPLLNSVIPLSGDPVNPYRPITGEPLYIQRDFMIHSTIDRLPD